MYRVEEAIKNVFVQCQGKAPFSSLDAGNIFFVVLRKLGRPGKFLHLYARYTLFNLVLFLALRGQLDFIRELYLSDTNGSNHNSTSG